jgi:hypothetical protein
MNKRVSLIVLFVLVAVLVASCGGGGGAAKPPVEMQTYEASTFTVDYPKAWQKSNIDMMGLSMVFFSTKEIGLEDLGGLDFSSMMSKEPVFTLMFVPSSLAGQMGLDDLDAAMDAAALGDELGDEDVQIIKEGDVTLDGAKGKLLIVKGTDPDMGKIGAHIVMAKKGDGTVVVLMGVTPEQDLDKNLKVFEYMQDTFKFK